MNLLLARRDNYPGLYFKLAPPGKLQASARTTATLSFPLTLQPPTLLFRAGRFFSKHSTLPVCIFGTYFGTRILTKIILLRNTFSVSY